MTDDGFPQEATLRVVEEVLRDEPEARDDDLHLYAMVVTRLRGAAYLSKPLWQIFNDMQDGLLPSTDSVTRYRRLLQGEQIALRGKKWDERHKREVKIRESLREYP